MHESRMSRVTHPRNSRCPSSSHRRCPVVHAAQHRIGNAAHTILSWPRTFRVACAGMASPAGDFASTLTPTSSSSLPPPPRPHPHSSAVPLHRCSLPTSCPSRTTPPAASQADMVVAVMRDLRKHVQCRRGRCEHTFRAWPGAMAPHALKTTGGVPPLATTNEVHCVSTSSAKLSVLGADSYGVCQQQNTSREDAYRACNRAGNVFSWETATALSYLTCKLPGADSRNRAS